METELSQDSQVNLGNINVPLEVVKKWPVLEFKGQPWKRDNFTWIRAYHKMFGTTWKYCFELDCAVDDGMYEFICKNGRFA